MFLFAPILLTRPAPAHPAAARQEAKSPESPAH